MIMKSMIGKNRDHVQKTDFCIKSLIGTGRTKSVERPQMIPNFGTDVCDCDPQPKLRFLFSFFMENINKKYAEPRLLYQNFPCKTTFTYVNIKSNTEMKQLKSKSKILQTFFSKWWIRIELNLRH